MQIEMQIAAGRFAHHGGRLGVARSLFPDVPQPWVDLPTASIRVRIRRRLATALGVEV